MEVSVREAAKKVQAAIKQEGGEAKALMARPLKQLPFFWQP